MTQVPLLDLKAQYQTIRDEVQKAVLQVLESQHFILGPEVSQLEKQMAEYCGVPYAAGVSSGTDALLLALMAEKVGPGDEVITTPYTFFATAGSIVRLGAKPVFVDILPGTFNLDPGAVEKKITPRTRAIMPVHLFGQLADMEPLVTLASRKGIAVIEDAAQAIGAEANGKKAGSFGDYGCFSFFPSKNLGGAGDGGLIVTSKPEKNARVLLLRNHGAHPKYFHDEVGGNFRLDAMQAAILRVKLRHLDDWNEARRSNAKRYEEHFKSLGLTASGNVQAPRITPGHVCNQYIVRVRERDRLKGFLKEKGIETEIYYPLPMHLQKCFSGLAYKQGDFPESEKAALETLALPIYPELKPDQLTYVAETIALFYKSLHA